MNIKYKIIRYQGKIIGIGLAEKSAEGVILSALNIEDIKDIEYEEDKMGIIDIRELCFSVMVSERVLKDVGDRGKGREDTMMKIMNGYSI